MQPLQLLLLIISAAGKFAKTAPMSKSETSQSARSPQLEAGQIPPSPAIGLKPFQFPTDFNATTRDWDGTPESWIYCSKTPELVNSSFVDELVDSSFLKITVDNGTIHNYTGLVWPYLGPNPSTQIYMCNHTRMFSFPNQRWRLQHGK